MILAFLQVSGDLSDTDLSSEARPPRAGTDTAEEKRRNRLYELAMKMSEKETSSGEDQESEPKTESENQKESLSSEDNSQSVQEELKKVRAMRSQQTAPSLLSLLPLGRGSIFVLRCAETPNSTL